jgi:sodium transport system permease protein
MTDRTTIIAPTPESTSRTWRLARKELREILRDRRTVITLVLMPLLVYPLLGVIMRKGVLSNISLDNIEAHVCFESEADDAIFATQVGYGNQLRVQADPQKTLLFPPADSDNPSALGAAQPLKYQMYFLNGAKPGETLEQQVADGYADLAVRVVGDQQTQVNNGGGTSYFRWEFIRAEKSAVGKRAFLEITECLEALNEDYTNRLLWLNDLPLDKPATIASTLLAARSTGPSPLITFIPLALVLMTMTGAVYPAIDLTAGERERGTMEILIASPVPRMTLLAGKFLAVLTVALLTASMNLVSMFATLFALGLEGTLLGNVGFTMIFQVVILMVVFAAFFSAVLLSITSVARSFKEAQAYLIPLMLISLTPGVFSLMPDLKINGPLAVCPLVNTVLMGRDLLLGNVNVLMFAIVLISTALYGVFALAIAARIFGSDAVLYGSGGTWTELLKRPAIATSAAPISVAMCCLAIVFSLFIVLGSIPSRLNTTLSNQLLAAGFTSVILFMSVPMIVAAVARVRFRSGFSFHLPSWSMWLVAVLLGGSLWTFIYELEVSMLTDERIEFLKKLFATFKLNLTEVPLWVKLFALAVAPAICEEFFFRGFLQNAIRQRTSAALSILCAGVLFGLFHVIVKDALLFERLLPSTLMGIVLGIVYERSGSVFPGMLLHLLHNGFLVTVSEYEKQLTSWGIGVSEHQHLPATWLLYATVPVAVAAVLLYRNGRASNSPLADIS